MACRLVLIVAILSHECVIAKGDANDVSSYNVIWTDLLPDSASTWVNTMPVGNGNTALNVWADNVTGVVSLLLAKADAWNEAAELMKVGMVNIAFNPNPFTQPDLQFKQELSLPDATVKIMIGGMLSVTVYVDALKNMVVVDAEAVDGKSLFDVSVSGTLIRPSPDTFTPQFDCKAYTVAADKIATCDKDNTIAFFHRNADLSEQSYFQQTLEGENIYTPEMVETVKDPLTNLTVGVAVFGDGLHRSASSLELKSGSPQRKFRIGMASLALQDHTIHSSVWLTEVEQLVAAGIPNKQSHLAWWSDFWSRSHVYLGSETDRKTPCNNGSTPSSPWSCTVFNCTCQGMADYYGVVAGVSFNCAPPPAQQWWSNTMHCSSKTGTDVHPGCNTPQTYCQDAFVVSRQYALQRYLQAIQARSPFPIKFNGMLFTAQKPPKTDYRQWGGHNWWQNWRLPYYNMLAAGDSDLLETMFEFFTNTLPLAKARTKTYYTNFTDAGAAFWPEYTSVLGTTHPSSYGCNRAGKSDPPKWYSEDRWNHYNVQGALDASLFLLDHYAHTQNTSTFTFHLPFVAATIEFFRQRWQANGFDSDGNIIIYPSQALETWQCPGFPPVESSCVTNDAPTVAGLQAVVSTLLSLPEEAVVGTVGKGTLAKWRGFAKRLPPLPEERVGNDTKLAPCQKCPPNPGNVENPELYAVHPFRLFTKAKSKSLLTAINAFKHKRYKTDSGWNQNAMDAALLGLGPDAQQYVQRRAHTPPANGYRFPAFMPHEQDYPPSSDHLAVFSNALTYMLLQTVDDSAQSVLLLPTWPCRWDVSFKLHAPLQTIITGNLTNGTLQYSVQPSSRAKYVSSARCFHASDSFGSTSDMLLYV